MAAKVTKAPTEERQYQEHRGQVNQPGFPEPGGAEQHRRRTRAYYKWLEKVRQTLDR